MEKKNICCSHRDYADEAVIAKLLCENEPSCHISHSYGYRKAESFRNQDKIHRSRDIPDESDNTCGCTDDHECGKTNALSGYHLAMSYTPDQEWKELFDIEEALSHGTIFRELEFPFLYGCRSCR